MKQAQYYSNRHSRQKGAGMVAWLILIAIAGTIIFQIFKLVPHYMESLTVDGELRSLAETTEGLESLTNREIKQKLAAFYRVNNVSSEVEKGTTITRKDGDVIIDMEYEHRIPMLSNIDVVLSFKKHLNSKFPHKCCSPSEDK